MSRTFVGRDRRVSVGTLGTPDHCPGLGTFGRHQQGTGLELDHQLAHNRSEAVEGEVQECSFVLEPVRLDRLVARLHHLQRVLARHQPCAGSLLPFCAASILSGFP